MLKTTVCDKIAYILFCEIHDDLGSKILSWILPSFILWILSFFYYHWCSKQWINVSLIYFIHSYVFHISVIVLLFLSHWSMMACCRLSYGYIYLFIINIYIPWMCITVSVLELSRGRIYTWSCLEGSTR